MIQRNIRNRAQDILMVKKYDKSFQFNPLSKN